MISNPFFVINILEYSVLCFAKFSCVCASFDFHMMFIFAFIFYVFGLKFLCVISEFILIWIWCIIKSFICYVLYV